MIVDIYISIFISIDTHIYRYAYLYISYTTNISEKHTGFCCLSVNKLPFILQTLKQTIKLTEMKLNVNATTIITLYLIIVLITKSLMHSQISGVFTPFCFK